MIIALIAPAFAAEPRLEDRWDLAQVYPSLEAWEGGMTHAAASLAELEPCRGQLAVKLEGCLTKSFEVRKEVNRLYTYAANHSSEDTRNAEWRGRAQRAELLWANYAEATAFFDPEIVAIGSAGVEAALAANPALKPFDHYLRSTAKDAAYTLDPAREALLAAMSPMQGAPGNIRGVLADGELPYPTVKLSDGQEVRLSASAYTVHRAAPNRADRELVFQSFFGALASYRGTYAATLDASTTGHWITARTRGFDTSVAAAMNVDHLPTEIYTTLVATTNKNLPTLHRYLKLRARRLGVTDLQYSDIYAPMVSGERHYTVDEAKALTLASSGIMGKEYTDLMKKGFGERWMDVYPSEGKRSGAYMDGGAYDVHPYVLLNFGGDFESVSTLAHEFGHVMHSSFASRAQPYAKADYATFIAEIASTFAEALLIDHMLKNAKDDEERLFYLGSALEGLRGTYFRQAQLGEFELAIHAAVERGEPLTADSLDAMYLDVLRRYYGEKEGVTRIDPKFAVEWAYIPHFYYNYYVYQYATSIAASSLLAEDVLTKKPGAVDRYLTLLKAGGSDEPYLLLKAAGVDMATSAPYDAIARRMDKLMDQIEAIEAKKAKAGGKKR
jgi:oligoendopeptidase F